MPLFATVSDGMKCDLNGLSSDTSSFATMACPDLLSKTPKSSEFLCFRDSLEMGDHATVGGEHGQIAPMLPPLFVTHS